MRAYGPVAIAMLLVLVPCASCGREPGGRMQSPANASSPQHGTLQLHSPNFATDAALPERLTCDGDGRSPALQWSGMPAGTRSLALIVDDPDAPDPAAPKHTWVHWVLYDLPPDSRGLPEGVQAAQLPHGTREGHNDWQRSGFGAPCPPTGRHRYVHTLYALDTVLPDLHGPDKARLLQAMEGHVLDQARLVGTYERRH